MKSRTEVLPILLRRETFGGILFDPADGTLLELDSEAMDLAVRFFIERGSVMKRDEKSFLSAVKKNIRYNRRRKIDHINTVGESKSDYTFHMFSAPTLVDFQITNKCYMSCSHCYASSTPSGEHASLDDVDAALSEMRSVGVCQVALGGGEPLLHPFIREVLDLCFHKGMVPNLSTSGMYLTKSVLAMLRKYCGAVAVSLENTGEKLALWRKTGFENIMHAVSTLIDSSIRTVIQVTLGADNFDDVDDIADFCISQKGLYGVIFLAYKPVGRGLTFAKPLSSVDSSFVSGRLEAIFRKLSPHMRVGYDCCLAPAIAANDRGKGFIGDDYIEGCSALRGSLGLLPGLDVVPCTFLRHRVLGNLKRDSLKNIWNGIRAGEFRNSLENKISENFPCSGCRIKYSCLGGCPEMDLVKCSQMERADEGKN